MCRILVSVAFAAFIVAGLSTRSHAQTPWFGGTYTHRAVMNGAWNNTATWDTSGKPVAGAVVLIDQGVTVTLNTALDTRLQHVQIKGTLRLSASGSFTKLQAETIVVESGGTLRIGTPDTAGWVEVIFLDTTGNVVPTPSDPQAMRRGLLSEGSVKVFGATVTPHVKLQGQALAGSASFPLQDTPQGWHQGDTVVFPATLFRQTCGAQGGPPCIYSDERMISEDVIGSTLMIQSQSPLSHHHRVRPTDGVHLSIAHLNRTVVFKSENSAPTKRRGHVMLMGRCADINVQNALFKNLGRTDKAAPLNDASWDGGELVPGTGTNSRGRYPVHVHMCDPESGAATVTGSVVWNTPGWGMVNHSSHVNFTNNVAYQFVGAGFVAEDGDEIGQFAGNLAVDGTGIGEFDLDRVYVGDHDRLKQADFAFHGDCFWFQSPIVEVVDNIAGGCQGVAFFYHAPGIRKHIDGIENPVEPVPFDKTVADTELPDMPYLNLDQLRYWRPESSDLLAVELPINVFDGNVAYGSFIGLKIRYVQTKNTVVYDGSHVSDHYSISQTPSNHSYAQYKITNSKFWNNQVGVLTSYSTYGLYENIFIGVNDNQLPPQPDVFDPEATWMGWAGWRRSAQEMTVTGSVTIREYPVCLVTGPTCDGTEHTSGVQDVQYLSCEQKDVKYYGTCE